MSAYPNQDVRYSSNSQKNSNASSATLRKAFNNALTLYVKCIPKSMTEDGVLHLFRPYGKVVNMRLELNDTFPKNRASVEMSSKEECEAALANLNGFEDGLGGKIYVEYKRGYQQGVRQSHSQPYSYHEDTPQHNTRAGYEVGAGRGSTLYLAAGASSPVRASPSHHRDPFLPHTGQFTPSSRGSARGRPYRHMRGGGYMGRPPQTTPSKSPTYNKHTYFPQRPPHPQNMQHRNHRGGGRTPGVPRTSPSGTNLSPQAAASGSQAEPNVEPCLHCQTPTDLRCYGCGVAPYCSRQCQTTHWTESHHLHCASMKTTTSASSSATDLSQFSVSFNQNVIETMKGMPAVADCLEAFKAARDSDTESVSSGRSEDPGLPLNELLQVKLTDFISPSQFYIQRTDEQATPGTLPRVWECSLHGLVPAGGASKWSEKAVEVCSTVGLALGGPCKVLCYDRKNSVYQTKVVLRNDVDLSDCLIKEGIAQVPADRKHEVNGSLHSKLEPGQSIVLVIDVSSVKGVTDFYAQVAHKSCKEELSQYAPMLQRLASYATHIANKPPASYRAVEGDYVLAPYESDWFRGLVTAANEHMAVIAYIDYGNIGTVIHSQLLPLPRQFTEPPALAVLCKLHGLDESADPQKQKECVKQIQALAKGGKQVSATVRTVGESHMTVDLFNSQNVNIAEILLRSGFALESHPLSEQRATADLPFTNGVIPVNFDNSSLSMTNDGMSALQSANEEMPALQSTNEDMPALQSANEDMPALQSTNEDMPALQLANEDMPALQSTNEDMPAFQSTNEDMPPLQATPNNTPAQSTTEDMPPLQAAHKETPRWSANENMPPAQAAHIDTPSLQSTNEHSPLHQLAIEDMPTLEPINGNMNPLMSSSASAAHVEDNHQRPESNHRKRAGGLARHKESSPADTCLPARRVIYTKDMPSLSLLHNERTRVLVVSSCDLHSIYVTLQDRDSLQHFIDNITMITQCLSDPSQTPPKLPLIEGEVVFALDPSNCEWDRVEVLNYCPNQPILRVRSLDYGESYDVDIRNVREMTDQAALLMARAVKVVLSGVEGTLSAEGTAVLASLKKQRVFICCREVKGQLMCEMETEDGEDVNFMIKSFCSPVRGASNGLDSHGSSSDGSLNVASPLSPAPIDTMAGGEGRRLLLEQQIETFRSEIQLLRGEITLLKANKNKSRKKVEGQAEEFTL